MARSIRYWITTSSAFLFLFVVLLAFHPIFRFPEHPFQTSHTSPDTCHRCIAPRKNIWADLSEEEAKELVEFLYLDSSLNLTKAANATAWDNHIAFVETLPPNKT